MSVVVFPVAFDTINLFTVVVSIVAAEVVRLRVVVNRAGIAGARPGNRRRILS